VTAAGTVYELTLPAPDPSLFLTSNLRLHWAVKARRVEHWRALAHVSAMAALRTGGLVRCDYAYVLVTVTWRTNHRRDPLNWADTAKPIIDGLVDAKVFPDDNMQRVKGPDMRGAVDLTLRHPVITVTITPSEAPL
jgi:hypothetical protein